MLLAERALCCWGIWSLLASLNVADADEDRVTLVF